MKFFEIDKLVASLQGYIETKIELVKLDAKDGLQLLVARIFVIAILVFAALMTLLFLSLGLSQFFNQVLKSTIYGYMIIGAVYLMVFIVLIGNKDRIIQKVSESIKKHD